MSHDAGAIELIEDDPVMGESLVQRLQLEGFDVTWSRTGRQAVERLGRVRPDAVICDLRLPDMSGEDLFRTAAAGIAAPFLFITAYGEIDQAVRLMRMGAADYVTKPFELPEFLERLRGLMQPAAAGSTQAAALGPSETMQSVEAMLRRIARLPSSVLLTGETGAGKEVCARFLHAMSDRAERPFMAVNCAAIPADLMESELFGHERGAFTSAHGRHHGYAERAGNGVLFLDEIGAMPVGLQAKLLRLIEERRFFRLGGERTVEFGARLVCATNDDLDEAVREGRFRGDLFYRINVVSVRVPPLRERTDDIPWLLGRFLDEFATLHGRDGRGLTALAEEAALAHDWPGNVRELRNRAERAVALCLGDRIGPADLFPEGFGPGSFTAGFEPLAVVREAAERRQIQRALRETGGLVGQAADLLGVSRTTMWEKMRRYGLDGT